MQKPEVTSSKIVHRNPWWHVHEDQLRWPDGKEGIYYVAEQGTGAAVICIRGDEILTIEQYRYCIDYISMELPKGHIESDEQPEAAAKRELLEETGYETESLIKLGDFFSNCGNCRSQLHVFYAEHSSLRQKASLDAWEQETVVGRRWMKISEWEQMIKDNKIKDLESLGCWMLYLQWEKSRPSLQ